MSHIRTTHTGSLHRPTALVTALTEVQTDSSPSLDELIGGAVHDVVRAQVDVGIDVINDGEQGKQNYSTYIADRLTGFGGRSTSRNQYRDLVEFPDFVELQAALDPARYERRPPAPACTGPIAVRDPDAVMRDIARLKAAAATAGIPDDRLFMSAASPGVIATFIHNEYYATDDEYLSALIDAMHHEYRAIVDAGIVLQLDCPDFAMNQGTNSQGMTVEEVRSDVAKSVEVLNAAVADLPPDRMRIHVCWGNNESPHVHDTPLRDVIDVIVNARPAGIAVEGANPRHGHEWVVFEEFALPDDKYLLPGVIDTTTNFVEHPELVAQRLRNYTRLVGGDRVVASTDCGFGTFAGRNRVARSIAWAKLGALVEGAALAID